MNSARISADRSLCTALNMKADRMIDRMPEMASRARWCVADENDCTTWKMPLSSR